ncbi:MAG: rod-binding protein [Leptospiraceae bacterium]|nr:rod-binding protein [Leptospiraceae bacterium]MCP5511488.1 rod-binding protein [Leptospiraceae bacterium]
MNSINSIQDYIQRLSITDSKLDKYKENRENLPADKDTKSFVNHLDDALAGKVSSSELRPNYNIKEEIQKDPYRKKLFNASVEFESMFVKLMLNEMRKTVEKQSMMHGGYAEEIFEDFLYDEYSKEISKNESLGLAEQIYSSLSKSLPPISEKEK